MARVLGRASEVPEGSTVVFNVDGEAVAVANVEGRFFGFSDICTHRGCSLSSPGMLEGTQVRCGCHGSVFNVTTGEVLRGPAREPIATYPIEIVGDELLIAEPAAAVPDAASAAPAPAATSATNGANDVASGEAVQRAFANIALFAGLDAESLETLEAFAFRRTFAPGEVIVEEGRTGNGLYVILSGRVEVVKGLGSPAERVLATLRPGEPFGELALLGDWKRTASVRAVDEVSCAGLDRWVFLAHLRRDADLAIKMLQYIAQRLVDTDAMLKG